ARLHLERARLAAGCPVDRQAAVLVLGAEIEREPLRRRAAFAAPARLRRTVECVLRRVTRRGARRAHARRLAQRQVLEAQVREQELRAARGDRAPGRDVAEVVEQLALHRSSAELYE